MEAVYAEIELSNCFDALEVRRSIIGEGEIRRVKVKMRLSRSVSQWPLTKTSGINWGFFHSYVGNECSYKCRKKRAGDESHAPISRGAAILR